MKKKWINIIILILVIGVLAFLYYQKHISGDRNQVTQTQPSLPYSQYISAKLLNGMVMKDVSEREQGPLYRVIKTKKGEQKITNKT